MPNYVNSLSFNYKYYQENILCVGMIGSGKTTIIKKILGNQNIKRFIWDESDQFEGFGILTKSLQDLSNSNHVVQLDERSQKTFDDYCNIIYKNAFSWKLNNLVNVIDEVQKYTRPQDRDSILMKIVTSLRNKGISNIFMTPSPSLIPRWIRENVVHIFGFQTNDYDHIEYMEKNFFGESAWLLTSQDKRKKLQNEPNLSKYSIVYRNIYENETQIWKNPEFI